MISVSQDLNQSFNEFLLNAAEKLKQKVITSMENQIQKDHNASPDVISALTVTPLTSIACVYSSPSTMLNPSSNYQFANNPGMDACSNPVLLDCIPANTFLPCTATGMQPICAQYSPDYKIVQKYEYSENNEVKYYYLTKFRSLDGSYFYKVYDSTLKVYFELSYKDIADTDSTLDDYAIKVFNDFIADSMLNLVQVNISNEQVPTESNRKSYLSTLIS